MDSYHIRGGKSINGECKANGAKNAALPILAATILTGSEVELKNCPAIADVENMLAILRALGCKTERAGENVFVDARIIDCHTIPSKLMKGMRSSVFLMGPMLVRMGEVTLSHPGGCEIGERPIDIHLNALKQLGVCIEEKDGLLICTGQKLSGADITLDFPSVGATENAMMAALAAAGETVIRNAAREPEIMDLQDFLIQCGAEIKGAGSDKVVINGKKSLHGAVHKIIPDRIEVGTLLAAAAATGGRLFIKDAKASHSEQVLAKLEEAECFIKKYEDGIYIKAPERLKAIHIATEPYPGFPTDMQSQFLTLMTTANGKSNIHETIFENRFKQVPELVKMGAVVGVSGQKAEVFGVRSLHGARVSAADLRGGASLVLAGLMADGETVVESIGHIERGYDKLDKVLNALGADIRGVTQ